MRGAAQELAEGRTLAQLVKEGWRGSQEEVAAVATQLLGVLQYLGSRLPPVTHRVRPVILCLASLLRYWATSQGCLWVAGPQPQQHHSAGRARQWPALPR